MATVEQWNEQFGAGGAIHFGPGKGDLPVAYISNDLAEASIALQGAHLLSYQACGEAALIWMSEDAQFTAGKSLRGGIPVCWPWFGPHAADHTLPSHGPARTADWQPVAAAALDDGSTQITFELIMSDAVRSLCAHKLRVQLHVTVGRALSLTLETTNLGDTSFTLGQALHTYFMVGDVRQVSVTGLGGCSYIDKSGGASALKEQSGDVRISAETDRIYLATGQRDCAIVDPVLKRNITIRNSGSDSMVVWNPWVDVAARMGDLGEEGYLNMLCVETTNAADDVRELPAGATHRLSTEYSSQSVD